MKTHARVVVIGGGVVGVSTLYHLALKGWSDVVLLERSELTAGSTWHAAGLLPLFNMSYTVGQLHKYSVDLYKRLPAETGQDVSFHVTGNLRLATNRDRMDEYQKYCGTANTIGVPFQVIGPKEVRELWPLAEIGNGGDTPNIVGALYHPDDGHIAPADLTMALRKGARSRGAEIHEQTEVTAVRRTASGEWHLTTTKGEIVAEHVVCATGNYARQTGRMFGINVPSIPVEHQYIVYDESPELKAYRQNGGRELAVLRESDESYYLREERMGWILGPYEAGAPARFADGVPDWFGKSLFEGDLERLLPHVEAAQRRVPSLVNCGIKDIVNGPIAYTPDGSPLIGPAWGVKNLWLNEGHSFGITAAGGSGWQLAEWIVEGEPGIDMMATDPRRYGPYTSKRYVIQKNEETYRNVFVIHYPDEERTDARPAKTTPIYDKLARMGAVFGQRYGWERANWFAPPRRRGQGQVELPPLELLRARGRRGQAHAQRRGRDRSVALHQARGDGPRRGSLARQPGRQQGADEDRPHGALPRAHPARRHPFRVHHHQDGRAAFLRGERPAPPSATTRTICRSCSPPTAASPCATSPPAAACSCWPAPARATCSPSSPTRRSTTRPSPGSPARWRRSVWRSTCTCCV